MKTDAKVWAPVATFVAVLGVGAAAVLAGGGGEDGPRPLRLADGGMSAADSTTVAAPVRAGGGYRLTGTLPAGTPDDAPAWTLPGGAGAAGPVARLAAALGEGTPTREGDGWRAGGLRVSGEPGRSWWWSSCGGSTGTDALAKGAPDAAVSSAHGSTLSCVVDSPAAVGSGGDSAVSVAPAPAPSAVSGTTIAPLPPVPATSPAPAPPRPTDDAVRRAAAHVLDALGLTGGDVQTYPGGGSVTVRPTVGGREVAELPITVDVDAAGTVVGAGGWLAEPVRGDDYPLVTAKEAFDRLPPVVRVASCALTPEGGCKDPGPAEVTGARLGLTVAPLREGGQVLVPAWLFDVKGTSEPVPAIAVQPQYLPQDEPPTSTDKPVPPPTQVDPAPARTALSFDSAFRAKTDDAVVVQYGDSGSCPHAGVTSAAKEDDTTVYVLLEADAMRGDVACTDDYRGMKVTVALQGPLGDRRVVDAATGREVPVS